MKTSIYKELDIGTFFLYDTEHYQKVHSVLAFDQTSHKTKAFQPETEVSIIQNVTISYGEWSKEDQDSYTEHRLDELESAISEIKDFINMPNDENEFEQDDEEEYAEDPKESLTYEYEDDYNDENSEPWRNDG